MEKEALQPIKPRFSEVCQQYGLDYQAMQEIADRAGVRKSVVDAMAVSVAVRCRHAIQVLAALSKYTGDTWALDTVQIALLHTFQELHAFHQFDLSVLSITSGISSEARYAVRFQSIPDAILMLEARRQELMERQGNPYDRQKYMGEAEGLWDIISELQQR